MAKVQIQVSKSAQQLLGNFSNMSLPEIEYFIRELNSLVTQKRFVDKEKREKFLLRKINQSALPDVLLQRYILLQEKMEIGKISDIEYQELLDLVAKEEKIRNKRYQYLLELSQLRGVSLPELINNLGLNQPHYA